MAKQTIPANWTRDSRNALNNNFTDLYGIVSKTRDELNAIIREQTQNGDLAPEVTQARGTYDTVGARMDGIADDLERRAVNICQPPYNVSTASSTTDVVAIVQQAVDYANTKKLSVLVPDGDYLFVSPLKLGDYTTLILKDNANIIRGFSNGGTGNSTIINKDTTNGNKNITIRGGIISIQDSTMMGKHLGFWNVDDLRISETKVRGCVGDWATIFRSCRNLYLDALDIDVQTDEIYTDGIHVVEGCEKIRISNCIVNAADDAIAFTVESDLSGTGNGIKDAVVSNCNFTTRKASVIKIMVRVTSTQDPNDPSPVDDTTKLIEDITISNLTAKGGTVGEGRPIVIEDRSQMQRIKRIKLNKINIDASQGAGEGVKLDSIDDISIDDLYIGQPQGTALIGVGLKDVDIKRFKTVSRSGHTGNGVSIRDSENVNIHAETDNVGQYGVLLGIADEPVIGGRVVGGVFRNSGSTGIRLENASGIKVLENTCTGGSLGITELKGSDYNIIKDNDVRNNTTNIDVNGVNTQLNGNIGHKTKGRVPFQLGSTATSITVAHGLGEAPSSHGIVINFRSSRGAITEWWTSGVTATHFTLNVDQAPGVVVDLSAIVSAGRDV